MEATIIVAIIAGVFASVCGPIITAIIERMKRKNIKKETKEDKIIPLCNEIQAIKDNCNSKSGDVLFCKQATHLLLKDRVVFLTEDAIAKNKISLSTRAFIEKSVKLLHSDGENGEMTACLDSIKNIPTEN